MESLRILIRNKLSLLGIITLMSGAFFFRCTSETDDKTQEVDQSAIDAQEAREAFDAFWTSFNSGKLSDSVLFNQTMSFFADDLLMPGDTGKPPGDGKGLFGWLKDYVKTNKPYFDITVDKFEASNDMAYVLYHYRETFTDIASGEYSVDVKHSAIMVLRKNTEGIWNCVVMKFT